MKASVVKLRRGWFWGFSLCGGDSLHGGEIWRGRVDL